jgi:hypothetical protein
MQSWPKQGRTSSKQGRIRMKRRNEYGSKNNGELDSERLKHNASSKKSYNKTKKSKTAKALKKLL